MQKNLRRGAVLALLVLLVLAFMPTFAQDGMWSDNWQGDSCPKSPDMTTAAAQKLLGEPVVRVSTYGCAFGWSGEARPFNIPAEWVVLDLSGETGKLVAGTGQKVNFTKVILFYIPGDSVVNMDMLTQIAAQKTDSLCALDPQWSVKSVTAAISADPAKPIVLTKNSQEFCTFVARGGNWKVQLVAGMIATVHPFGTEGSPHAGGEDDISYMLRGGDGTVQQVFATTLRVGSGTPEDDPVNNDVCKLWHKEIVNGALDVKSFLVLKGNLTECKYNPDLARQVIRELGGTDATIKRNLNAFEKINPFYIARYPNDSGTTTAPEATPAVTLATTAQNCQMTTVNDDGVNVHSAPKIESPVIGILPKDTPVVITGKDTVTAPSWWQYATGWVADSVVVVTGDCTEVPITK